MTARLFVLLSIVLLGSSAAAQGGEVLIRAEPALPIAGQPTDVAVRFLETTPEAVSLFTREVGEAIFSEQVATLRASGNWVISIDEISQRGIEVYTEYVLDGETFTLPLQSPELFPFRIPVLLLSVTSGVELTARQYRMVSVPVQLGGLVGLPVSIGSDDPLDVFGDDFGETGDPAQWRLLRWDPLQEDYRDAIRDRDGEVFELVRPGAGYWLIASSGGTFDVEQGISTGVAFQDGEPFGAEISIPVLSGWNQIGNPFLFPIAWDDVRRPAAVEDPVAYTQGAFLGGQTTLQPWQGYFVFNPGPSGRLRFRALPGSGTGTETRTLSERVRERAGVGAAALRVTAVAGGVSDEVTLGVRGAAREDGAPSDLRKPPPVDGGLRLAARAEGEDWISHFQPRESAVWTLTVSTPDGAAVDLRLARLGDWPDGLVVQDLDTGEALPVVGDRVRVPSLRGVTVRRLAVRAGASAVAVESEAPRLGVPHPNPSAGSVTLPLAISAPARLDVLDVLGRTVRSLDISAETTTATWDGLDAGGDPVAAGVYLLRLSTEAGSVAVRVTRLR